MTCEELPENPEETSRPFQKFYLRQGTLAWGSQPFCKNRPVCRDMAPFRKHVSPLQGESLSGDLRSSAPWLPLPSGPQHHKEGARGCKRK